MICEIDFLHLNIDVVILAHSRRVLLTICIIYFNSKIRYIDRVTNICIQIGMSPYHGLLLLANRNTRTSPKSQQCFKSWNGHKYEKQVQRFRFAVWLTWQWNRGTVGYSNYLDCVCDRSSLCLQLEEDTTLFSDKELIYASLSSSKWYSATVSVQFN